MFDDCYEHEVFNETEEERVLLLLDVVRPLKWLPDLCNKAFILCMQYHPTVLTYKRNAPLSLHQGSLRETSQ